MYLYIIAMYNTPKPCVLKGTSQMTKILVIPKDVFEHFQATGVQLNKLLDIRYLASVSSVIDMALIHEAIARFNLPITGQLDIELADSPLTLVGLAAKEDSDDQIKLEDLYNRLESRLASSELRIVSNDKLVYDYYLYPVDENLWVAVQQSAHIVTSDPNRFSIEINHSFFDSMINQLCECHPFHVVASTNIFTYYLESL